MGRNNDNDDHDDYEVFDLLDTHSDYFEKSHDFSESEVRHGDRPDRDDDD